VNINFRRSVALLVTLGVAVVSSACTRSVRVPPESYSDPEVGAAGQWRVIVRGDREYTARRFHVNDAELVIEEFDSNTGPGRGVHSLPYVIPLEDVIAVEEVRESRATLPILVGTALLATLAIAYVVGSIPED
jgi:hypothetical protein